MSQIADFYVFPASVAAEVKAAATPGKAGWFGKAKDDFYPTLTAKGRSVLNFGWSGYVFVVLIEYLKEKHGIDLEALATNDLAAAVYQARKTYCLAFSADDAKSLLNRMSGIAPDKSELAAYWNDFTEEFDEAGPAMLAALDSLRRCLADVTEGHTGLMLIG